jgi:hypothetical protein
VPGASVVNSLHIVCLTESGAQPNAPPALLLLVLPLLLAGQNAGALDAIIRTRPLLFSIDFFLIS